MNRRRTAAVARKEVLHIMRDPRSLIMALALPAFMLILFSYALTLDVDRIPLAVYDMSSSTESRELISQFGGSRYFALLGKGAGYSQIERAIDRDECLMALVIPEDFGRDLSRGVRAEVQLLVDGSDSNTASIGLGYADRILARYQLGLRVRTLGQAGTFSPLDPQFRVWYNSELKSKNYIVPGLVAVILMIIAALLTSLTIAREWEMGTMEQLMSTPVRSTELVLGKMSAYFGLGVIDTVMVIVLGVVVFEVPLRGSLVLLGVSCFVFLFGALCWGIFLSAMVRNQLLAYQLGMITSFLPAFLLSGFLFAIENMPLPVEVATYIVPARYLITLLRGVFLKGVGISVVYWELLFLAIFAFLVFVAASRRLKRKVA